MKLLVLLSLFIFSISFAARKKEDVRLPKKPPLKNGEYALFVDQGYKIFTLKSFESVRVNENCMSDKLPTCKAALAVRFPKPYPQSNTSGSINPGGRYCVSHGAKNLIATDSKNAEFDFCYFEDGSIADSWGLYDKHFPIKKR